MHAVTAAVVCRMENNSFVPRRAECKTSRGTVRVIIWHKGSDTLQHLGSSCGSCRTFVGLLFTVQSSDVT